MKPHKHAYLIKAWADGAIIQRLDEIYNEWQDTPNPAWAEDRTYRIKPEQKPDVVYTTNIKYDFGWKWVNTTSTEIHNLRLIFDGETGQLKSAEVI